MNARGQETKWTPHTSPLCCNGKRQWAKQLVGLESCSGLAPLLQRLQVVEQLLKNLVYNERVVCSLNVSTKWPSHLKDCRKVILR